MSNGLKGIVAGLSLIIWPSLAFANVDTGDTAWILTATALVLFMTLPGLALFYAGLVAHKNIVSVLQPLSSADTPFQLQFEQLDRFH